MSNQVRKNRLLPILILVSLPLIGGAIYLRTAPARAERALQKASYSQLTEAVKRDPGNPRVFYYFGLRNRDLGKLGPARAALAHAAELDPDGEDIALARAAVAGEAGSDQETFEVLTAFLKRHPDSVNAHWALALFYSTHDSPKRSYEEALKVAQKRPQDVKAWRLAGVSALQLNLWDAAEQALRKAIALDPKDWRSQYGLGESQLNRNHLPEALAAYQAAANLAPDEPLVVLRLGFTQFKAETGKPDLQRAEQTLTHAVQVNPNAPLAYLTLGETQMRLGDDANAKTSLLEAERLSPYVSETHYFLARVYQALHDPAGADRETRLMREAKGYEQERDRLIGLIGQPGFDLGVYLKLGHLYAAHGETAEAALQYRRLLGVPAYAATARQELATLAQKNPQLAASSVALPLPTTASAAEDVSSLLHDADALEQKKQVQQAADAYQAILKKAPNSALAWQGLGTVYREMGKNVESFHAMSQALALDPKLPEAQFILAAIYYDSGLSDESARRLQRLIQESPTKAAYFNALGDCQRDDEAKYVQAEDNYRRATELAPNQPEYLVNLADMETLNHKQTEAETHYRRAVQLAPNAPLTQTALGRFLITTRATPENLVEAERLLRGALVEDPKNEKALVYLGQLLVQRGNAKDAIPLLEAAVLQSPNRKEPWYNLARAYDMLHNKPRADYCYAAFRRVGAYTDNLSNTAEETRTHPKEAASRLKLARLYAEGGVNTKAINQYQTYLALNPKDTKARKEMQTLIDRLKAEGHLPDMGFFNQMVASSVKFH